MVAALFDVVVSYWRWECFAIWLRGSWRIALDCAAVALALYFDNILQSFCLVDVKLLRSPKVVKWEDLKLGAVDAGDCTVTSDQVRWWLVGGIV